MCSYEQLPKIWMGRIQKYWDKIMPADFPVSGSTFSLSFESDEVKAEVDKFEAEINTEESVVLSMIPENTVVSNYIGTYDVDGTPGELTLLSPEKVTSNNVVALHLNGETNEWEKIEDVQIIDGYLWGTLESFSPIAIVEYKKEIHAETAVPGITATSKFVVCEGNAVKIYEDEDGVTHILNTSTGKDLVLEAKTLVIGGSIDGSKIEKTSITIVGVTSDQYLYKVFGGSAWIGDGSAEVGEVNIYAENALVSRLSGSFGAVRTMKVNYSLKNTKHNWLGAGESYAKVNTPEPSFASRAWIKDVNLNLIDVTCPLTYLGQNNEYCYVDNTFAYIEGGKHDYVITGGSNASTKTAKLEALNTEIGIFQTVNRGDVASSEAVFTNCKVENLFIGGDATDSTVTGTTQSIKIEINAGNGSYNIVPGVNDSKKVDAEFVDAVVKSIKVSRNAGEVTVDPELEAMLGAKYIIK